MSTLAILTTNVHEDRGEGGSNNERTKHPYAKRAWAGQVQLGDLAGDTPNARESEQTRQTRDKTPPTRQMRTGRAMTKMMKKMMTKMKIT